MESRHIALERGQNRVHPPDEHPAVPEVVAGPDVAPRRRGVAGRQAAPTKLSRRYAQFPILFYLLILNLFPD